MIAVTDGSPTTPAAQIDTPDPIAQQMNRPSIGRRSEKCIYGSKGWDPARAEVTFHGPADVTPVEILRTAIRELENAVTIYTG